MPFAVERRPLKPGEENKLWKFVYDNVVTNDNYTSLFELFKSYQRQGHLQNYGLTEVEFHFHKRMLRNLYKTDGLTSAEILTAYRHFQIPIEAEVRKILDLLTNANLRCNKSGILQSWRPKPRAMPIVKRETRRSLRLPAMNVAAAGPIAKRKKKTRVNGYVEVRMWRHLAKYAKKIKHTDVLTLRFWAKMKMHWKYDHIAAETLLAYFNETLRHRLYYLKMDAESKAWLIHHLSMKPTRAQVLWMLHNDKIYVDVAASGYVRSWCLWKERRPIVQMLPLEGYEPIKQYEPRPDFFYEHRIRYEARLNAYKGLKADFNGVIKIPTTKQRERVPEEFTEYLEFVEESKKSLNHAASQMLQALVVMRRVLPGEEEKKLCDRILMQLETEWLQAAMQKVLNILEVMNPSIPNPPLKKIKIHRCFWPFAEDEDEEGWEADDEVYENHEQGVDSVLNDWFFKKPVDLYVGGEKEYLEHRARREEARRRRRIRADSVDEMEDDAPNAPKLQGVVEISDDEDSEEQERDGASEVEEEERADEMEFDDVRMVSVDEGVGSEADADAEDEEEENGDDATAAADEEEEEMEHEVIDISSHEMEQDSQPSPPSAPPSPLPTSPPRQESELIDVDTVSSDDCVPMARRLGSSQESSYLPVVYEVDQGHNDNDQMNAYELMILAGMPDDEWRRIEKRLSEAEANEEEEKQEEETLFYDDEEEVYLAIQKDIPSTSSAVAPLPPQLIKQEILERKSKKQAPVVLPTRRSTRIAHRQLEAEDSQVSEKKKLQLPPGTFYARGDKGVYTFGSFQFYIGPDRIARAVTAQLVYEKTISDTSDIVKYYAQLDKPPVSFADRGISFVRDGAKFELKLLDKSKKSIEEERERGEVKTTSNRLQLLLKRRALSPIGCRTQPPVKSRRMSSTRHYSPSSSRIESNGDDDDIHKSVLFAKNRGLFPVVRQLNIPDFQ